MRIGPSGSPPGAAPPPVRERGAKSLAAVEQVLEGVQQRKEVTADGRKHLDLLAQKAGQNPGDVRPELAQLCVYIRSGRGGHDLSLGALA
ncbi:MAG: hypothetical protein V9G10_02220 [Candidatus Nanopelagicales bacterium]